MDKVPIFKPLPSKYLVFTADYLLPFFITLGVGISAYITLYSSIFNVTSISCTLDFEPCQNGSVLAELDNLKGQNIFRLKPSVTISRLTSGDFTIREAVITKVLPNLLKVNLDSVYPVASLKTDTEDTWIVLDSKLRVIATKTSNPNVPTVILSHPLTVTVGKMIDDQQVISALRTAIKIADELIGAKSIRLIDDNTLVLTLDNGQQAFMNPKKDELVQLRTLQAILADDTISKEVNTIDVRFSQPVLR